MAALRALLLAALLAVATPTTAQEADPAWIALSERADALLVEGTGEEALLALREELVDWRARFQTAQSPASARIDALRAQVAALGPAPEDGATEAADIAAQRADLTDRLDMLQAPIRAAQAAFTEADGLVAETDRLIEARRAQDLLRRGAAPINPATWPPALAVAGGWLGALADGLRAPFATPEARAAVAREGVELGVLAFAATLLLWRSGAWLGRLRDRIMPAAPTRPGIRVTLLAISVARTLLPVLGLMALARIGTVMGVQGGPAATLGALLPQVGLIVLGARWLAIQSLPTDPSEPATLQFGSDGRREARLHFVALGALFATYLAIRQIGATLAFVESDLEPFVFVVQLFAGVNMVRLGQLLLAGGRAVATGEEAGVWPQVLRFTGRAIVAVGVAAPLASAVGYVALASAILWPTVLTLALFAAFGMAQNLLFDLHATATRREAAGRDALLPTLAGFALVLACLPVLALIWGVRPSLLGEWWLAFLGGFAVGETRISPASFLLFAVVFGAGWLVVRLVKGVLRTNVLPKTKLDSGGTNAILSGTGYVGVTLAALLAITAAGIDLSGLAIVAGALSLGIGFGLQTIVQNFVSGIILLIERPIKIGDWIQAGGVEGFVRDISVRSTRIETFDRQDVIVPNADLIAGVVTNYTLSNAAGRVVLTIGVAYGSDTRRVQAILQEVAEGHPMVILNPPPLVTFDGFGADSLDFTIRVVIRDILWKPIVASEINHALAERFKAEGLEIPFAQRDVWLRNPEALRGQGAPG